MRRNKFFILLVLICFALVGCRQTEYNELSQNIVKMENEIEELRDINKELKQEKGAMLEDIEKLEIDNKELFESTLLPYHYFDITREEYIEKIQYLQNNPQELWINGYEISLMDGLRFEIVKEYYTNKYMCEVFSFQDTGERCVAEIKTLKSDVIISIKFTYYYCKDGTNSQMGYQHYFNYTDMFFSAFIMLNRGSSETDDEFGYYFERFFEHGAYFEGNAWVDNYISDDGKSVVLHILPVGLKR